MEQSCYLINLPYALLLLSDATDLRFTFGGFEAKLEGAFFCHSAMDHTWTMWIVVFLSPYRPTSVVPYR